MGSGSRQPLVFPNVYHITISYPPPYTPFNDLQVVVNVPPSIKGVASKLCSQNITIREVLSLVNSRDQ